ncbi:MAG TPA: SRPBCC family protein [Candidatus Limnocylindria bacterium]|nr:SRPBCC family protein [Candidatus Limnocylindria bacterium]
MDTQERTSSAAVHAESHDDGPRLAGRRRDLFLFSVPPEHVLELAADPARFPEFNPLVRVPEPAGRVEQMGNVYHQVIVIGPVRLSSRWETVSVDPPALAERPRPAPPWTTVEIGRLPIVGTWSSTTRYDAVRAGTRVTHDLEYQLPGGLIGRLVDAVVMRPILTVGFAWLGRRLRRWVENAPA